jgi:hypothetical protein
MSKLTKLRDDALLHILTRVWVKAIQLDDRVNGRAGNTRFRKVAPGRYALDINVPMKADVVDGVAQVAATGSMAAIADFLVAREKRVRELSEG